MSIKKEKQQKGVKMKKISYKKVAIIFLCTLFMIFLVSGCSGIIKAVGSGDVYEDMTAYTEEFYAEPAQASPEMMESDRAVEAEMAAKESGYYASDGLSDSAADMSGKVIKSAGISIEVKRGEFEKTLFDVTAIAQSNNGFVSNSQSYSDSDGNLTSGYIQIRVEQARFDAVINMIKEMGTVKSISMSGQDVTQEYVDLQSRLKNLNAQEEVLLDLMKQAKNVKDSVEVQRELSLVQGEIEIIKGRMNYLDNMVSYSTIDVSITEPTPITSSSGNSFIDAIRNGLRGALNLLRGMVMALIVISPLVVIAGIILIIVWQSIRARNRKRAKKTS